MKVCLSPGIIPCGWLDLKHQLTSLCMHPAVCYRSVSPAYLHPLRGGILQTQKFCPFCRELGAFIGSLCERIWSFSCFSYCRELGRSHFCRPGSFSLCLCLSLKCVFKTFFKITFYYCIVPMGFHPRKIRVAFPGESQLRQSRATQPTVYAGCLSVSIMHRTLACTTGSLTCTQMLTPAIAHGGVRTP